MNTASVRARSPASAGPWGMVATSVLILGSLFMAAVVGGDDTTVIVASVTVVIAGLAVTWLAPTRYPVFVLIFLGLSIEAAGEGPWDSPLAAFGTLLNRNINKSMSLDIPLTGVAFLLLLVLLVQLSRVFSGVRPDGPRPAPPLLWGLGASCVAVFALVAWGWVRGGDLQMAKTQVQNFVLMLLVAYLIAAAFRVPRDYRTLGRVIIGAACLKALTAVYIVRTLPAFQAEYPPEYATSHGDSLLFAMATVLLLVRFAEQPSGRLALWCLTLLPLIGWGMVVNERRIVWVEIVGALMIYWMVSRRSRAKRMVARGLVAASPLIIVYMVVGWNSQSGVFAPVQAFRSTGVFGGDEQIDASTLYREAENYNLMVTMRDGPFFGTGFGHPFIEAITLPNISFFKEYRYMPHNSVLGLWAFTGAIGFTGMCLAFVAAVYLAARSYRLAQLPEHRTMTFMVLAGIWIYAMHCYGDIGFSEPKSALVIGPVLAIAGQMATVTGAWRTQVTRPAASAATVAVRQRLTA